MISQLPETNGVWLHTGKLLVRSDLELLPPVAPAGGQASLVLPDGIITTPMLAPNAAQQLIGSYVQQISGPWIIPNANVWNETPIQVTLQFTGVLVRLEFAFAVVAPTKGQHVAWGIMVDGANPQYVLGAIDAPEASYGSMATGVYYFTPPVGSHRFAIGLNGPSGTQLGQTIYSTLYVTEQKR